MIKNKMKKLSIYIHIPFCVKKCDYCDFLSTPASRQRQVEYLSALDNEIRLEAGKYSEYIVTTVFFGGGTPSILEAGDIVGIMSSIYTQYHVADNAEITMELNPKTASFSKLCEVRKAGINRLSIGLQSADNNELKLIGRIHSYEDFLQTYKWAREAGFGNINIDLMSALPDQNMDSWTNTLNKVFELDPEHISAYSLIIEEGTRLYDNLSDYPPIPDEDEDRLMYQETKRLMAIHGYDRYEISNYAKEGYECRHNLVYWQRGNYVGFGIGASSMVENVRWKNTDDIGTYIEYKGNSKDCQTDIQVLSENECIEEYMFLGLRMMKGVSKTDFINIFGKKITDIYAEVIDKWIKLGMILEEGDYYRLSDKGIDVSNMIFSDFIL
jgi:oxygen-independent coproporphyrinogen-3 oxidase